MKLIIEGNDKSGKTTLANAIVDRFGCTYFHFGKPTKYPATEYAEAALKSPGNIVYDRFYLGELVYGPLLRGKVGITPLELVIIERILRLKQAILIQTTTDVTLANKRLLVSTQEEMVNQAQNVKAAKRFKKLLGKSNLQHVIQYDGSTRKNLNGVLDQLEVLKDVVEKDQSVIKKVCTGIGTPVGPKLVFVGEAVNKNVTWLGLPFDKGFSSQFLFDSFKSAGVPEEKVYICNADKVTSGEVEFLTCDKATFVALGKKADEKLKFLDVPHHSMPHPQYVKRFHWKEKEKYVEDFAAIVKKSDL
ncbi:MAG: uracil-DNA glycosylase family protein [bacterium]